MPAKFDLTWDGKNTRWRVQHEGKRFVVSCRQLGMPPTKEGSYQAANRWWSAKLMELQGQPKEPAHPHHDIIDHLDRRIAWARTNHLEGIVANAEASKYMVLAADGMTNEEVLPFVDANTGASIEAWSGVVGESIPSDKSLSGLSQRFLHLSETRVQDGELSAAEHDLAHRCVHHFVDWIGPNNSPIVITPDKWEAYWRHLRELIANKRRSREYAKKDWRYARSFIEWMANLDKLPVPKNLHDKRYKIGESHGKVITFELSEIKQILEGAPGQLKLHLLLMLNCGFYQNDISSLLHSEVDYEAGKITRQRSKTRQHHGDKIPTVSYKLWPMTAELLCRHRSNDPLLALVNLRGKPWVEEKIVDNRVKSRRDGIKSNFAHLAKDLKITKPLKSLRKTSATLLDSEAKYSRFVQHFLGHASKTVAEEHYLDRGGSPFDEAIMWLGQQYGLK